MKRQVILLRLLICLAHAQILHTINFKVLFTIGGCVFPSSDNSKLSWGGKLIGFLTVVLSRAG